MRILLLSISFVLGLSMVVDVAEAGPKTKLAKKVHKVSKRALIAKARKSIANQIKHHRAREAKLKAQLKATQTRLRSLYQLLKKSGGMAVQGKNAVRQCKRAMRRTFGPHDTRKERKALLTWCEKTFANAKVFAPLAR